MTSGGNNFNNFPENQLTKFSAVNVRLTPGDRHPLVTLLLFSDRALMVGYVL